MATCPTTVATAVPASLDRAAGRNAGGQARSALNASELAGCSGSGEEPIDGGEIGLAGAHYPLQRPRIGQGKGDAHLRIEVLREFELVGVDDSIVGLTTADQVERTGLQGRQRAP